MTTCDASMFMNTNQTKKFLQTPFFTLQNLWSHHCSCQCMHRLEHESGFLTKLHLLQTVCVRLWLHACWHLKRQTIKTLLINHICAAIFSGIIKRRLNHRPKVAVMAGPCEILVLQACKGQLTYYHSFGTQSASFHLHPWPAMANSTFLCLRTYSIVTMSSSGVTLNTPPSKARTNGHSTWSKRNQNSSRLKLVIRPTQSLLTDSNLHT